MRVALYGNVSCEYSSETHHAASLEQLGHKVERLQEPHIPAHKLAAVDADLFVWIHTHSWPTAQMSTALARLRQRGIPVISYHLDRWLGIRREQDMHSDPYWTIDHFFTVDEEQAHWLNENTPVKGHYLPAGVYGSECYEAPADSPHGNDVLFVGSKFYHPEYPMRPMLIQWLRDTYGDRFTHAGGDGQTGVVRGHDLNRLYASSKIAIGDSLCLDPNYRGKYWSDRVYESTGRFAFMLHPWLYGMDEQFKDGEHLVYYRHGDFDHLKSLIDHYLEHDDERERIRRAGHEHTKTNHVYTNRWETILETVFP